jgi:hypothetical protein
MAEGFKDHRCGRSVSRDCKKKIAIVAVMAGPTIPTNSTKLARTIGRLGKPALERGQGTRLGVLANEAAVNPASFLAAS